MKKLWNLIKKTFSEWNEDKAPRLAAALAYYTIFSIPPVLVIAIGIAGFFFGRSNAQGAILTQISGLIGAQSADAIRTILQNTRGPGNGLVASMIGIVILLFSASGVFGQLQDALNTMWEVKPKPGQGLWAMIRNRFFTFTMVVGVGFLLLVSLVASAALQALGGVIRGLLPGSNVIFQIVNFLVSFLVITLMFALTFRYVPDAKIAWKDVWLGAAVTSLLFTIGKQLIGLYLGNSNVGTTFGIFSSLVIILLWVYYSAQILLFGAEFTRVYANLYGSRVVPEKDAEPVTEEMRQQQGIPHKETQPERPQREAPKTPALQPDLAGGVAGSGRSPEDALVTLPRMATKSSPSTWQILSAAYPSLLALAVGVVGSLIIVRDNRKK